jgi:hypothetical protein
MATLIRASLVILLGWFAVVLLFQAQTPMPLAAAGAQPPPEKKYIGSQACGGGGGQGGCHAQGSAKAPTQGEGTEYVLRNEYHTWRERDPHVQGYEVLKGERGRRMGEALKWDVTARQECLSCHAAFHQDEKIKTEGVNCEGCHGSGTDRWFAPHVAKDLRGKTPQEKAALGMTNVWDPTPRANLCLSCHLGDAAKGRVVTHAMYVAGHPPLPGVELATFSQQEPRHWFLRKEKKVKPTGQTNVAFEQSEQALIGGVVALRSALHLLTAPQQPAAPRPDLAHFDCYACHHDLKRDSWYLERSKPRTPGRPPLTAWPFALVRAASHCTPDEGLAQSLEKNLAQLELAVTRQPFGDPQTLPGAAAMVQKDLARLLADLQKGQVNAATARAALNELYTFGTAELHDFDTARVVLWAVRTLRGELGEADPPALAELDALMKAQLHDPANRRPLVDAELTPTLAKVNGYDAREFRRLFTALAQAAQGGSSGTADPAGRR